jgi:hypothetical protein
MKNATKEKADPLNRFDKKTWLFKKLITVKAQK